MARLRSDFKGGVLTDNPLAFNALTAHSTEFAALPTVTAPDVLVITLDPDSVGGVPEVVYVTDHQPGTGTVVTMTRGQETADGGSVARQHAQGIKWEHGPTVKDFSGGFGTSPTASAPGDASAIGTSDYSARQDHKHAREAIDGATLEFTTDLHVKAGGIGATQLADTSITGAKFAASVLLGSPSATSPVSPVEGDFWYVNSGAFRGRVAYYDGTNWVPVFGKMPFLWVKSASSQAVTNSATWSAVTGMTVTVEDTESTVAPLLSGGGLVVPAGLAGRWRCGMAVRWGATGSGNRGVAFLKGATAHQGQLHHDNGTQTLWKTLRLAAADTVKPAVQATSDDGALDSAANLDELHWFQAEYLGP